MSWWKDETSWVLYVQPSISRKVQATQHLNWTSLKALNYGVERIKGEPCFSIKWHNEESHWCWLWIFIHSNSDSNTGPPFHKNRINAMYMIVVQTFEVSLLNRIPHGWSVHKWSCNYCKRCMFSAVRFRNGLITLVLSKNSSDKDVS